MSDLSASVPVPIRSLGGVRRIFLKPGEKQKVSFVVSAEQMSLIDDAGKRMIEPGKFMVSVGGQQPGFKGWQNAQTTGAVSANFQVTGKVTEVHDKRKFAGWEGGLPPLLPTSAVDSTER